MELRTTNDGSLTLYSPTVDEHYHSTHGALCESLYVFIEQGLRPLLETHSSESEPLSILEAGLGTGLNALLTLQAAHTPVTYTAFDIAPVTPDLVEALASAYVTDERSTDRTAFRALHAAPWNLAAEITAHFTLEKRLEQLENASLPENAHNLIYFDAFSPRKQPELWTVAVFEKLLAASIQGGVLVSYCAQGQFRRDLRTAGWKVESLPGPPGKREMTRARKP